MLTNEPVEENHTNNGSMFDEGKQRREEKRREGKRREEKRREEKRREEKSREEKRREEKSESPDLMLVIVEERL